MENQKETKVVEYYPYIKKKYFFTMAELKFYKTLQEIMGDKYYIFPKVRISDLIEAKYSKTRYKWFNKIKSKHVDFLICDKDPITSKAIIELDDSSHSSISTKTRDQFVNEAFANAGIPTVHVRARSKYNKEDLIQQIKESYDTKYTINPKDNSLKNKKTDTIEPKLKLAILVGLLIFFFLLLKVFFT
jgi:very-short-patch-repair endonuclease